MLLREFLYVDTDKVRGLLAQLDEGIVEGSKERGHQEKVSGAGLKNLAQHSQRWGSDTTVEKSMGDALFPTLEQALESEGILTDLSAELMEDGFWGDSMRSQFPPGSLVRITAPGALFDARYVGAALSAFATSWQGLTNVGVFESESPTPVLPKKGTQGGQRSQKRMPDTDDLGPRQIESDIPNVVIFDGDSKIGREYLQGIVRVARGMFSPGIHLNMRPADSKRAIVTARLQEGRQFLDSDAEVVFSRYGVGVQEWTLVGSIGHYGDNSPPGMDASSLLNKEDDSVNRAGFAEFVNNFLLTVGETGFIDLPQYPSFSVVPLAVYRVVGNTNPLQAEELPVNDDGDS